MRLINSYLGNWGRYQAFVYALQFVPAFFMTAMALQLSFTVMTPNHRCFLGPDIDNREVFFPNVSSALSVGKRVFYPAAEDGEHSRCTYCPSNATDVAVTEQLLRDNATCEKERAINCDQGYVWQKSFLKNTLGMTWEMVCQEGSWKADFSKSLTMVGFFIGAGLFGTLADRFGRRPVFLVTSYLQILTTNVVPLVPNLPLFCILQIASGALSHGSFIICFNIAIELIGGSWGVACGIGIQVISAFGTLYAGSLAFFIDDWRYLHWGVSVFTILNLLHYWLLDESIRWQIVEGRKTEALKTMVKALNMNRIKFDGGVLKNEIDKASEEIAAKETVQLSASHLFTDVVMARNTFIVFLTWAACSGSYYGLSFNTEDIPGDMRTNFLISTVMEIPGCLVVIPMLQKLGRKFTMALSLGLAGLSILMTVVLSMASVSSHTPFIVFAALGRLGASGAFAAVYVFSAELYPTCVRNSAVGYSSMCARVGSILAPQVHYLAFYTRPWVPSLIYGSFCTGAALLNLLLPETRGLPLPESMRDGIALHRGLKTKTGKNSVDLEKF